MSNFEIDLITESLTAINREYYPLYENGSRVYQASAPEIIDKMLRMLRPNSGNHILEIGTGSGYSTALLAKIISPASR